MNIDKKTLKLLKKYGFQWQNNCTEKIYPPDIKKIVPAANGFTVVYVDTVLIEMTTANVEKIEIPEDPSKNWITVHVNKIEDQKREKTLGKVLVKELEQFATDIEHNHLQNYRITTLQRE
jgi:hypothetical protein